MPLSTPVVRAIGPRSSLPLVPTLAALALCVLAAQHAAAQPKPPDGVRVRDGYELIVADSTIRGPRMLCLDSNSGAVYVSLPEIGEVRACFDADGDGRFDRISTFVTGHRSVHGLAWHDGWLYFAEGGGIFRAADADGNGRADREENIILRGKLPSGGENPWRALLIHKDRLYTAIGDSGNLTDETKTPRQKIWSYTLDGTDEKLLCSGIRDTAALAVRPGTDEIWGPDGSSEWFGAMIEKRLGDGKKQPISDFNPPCEINRYDPNAFYGHPFIVGAKTPRQEYFDRKDLIDLAVRAKPPLWTGPAHAAPIGLCFYSADADANLKGHLIVAYHGSDARTEKTGCCVSVIYLDDGKPWGERVLVNFLSEKGATLGSPVDVIQDRDGSLLFSDDGQNRIYRLKRTTK